LPGLTTMSYRVTPFCKVCYDAGKPKELYLNHFVKDRPGPGGCVVCPTLLNQECRYCKEKGHTPTHCPKLADKQQSRPTVSWSYQTPRKTYTTQSRVVPGAPPRVRREEKNEDKVEDKVSARVVSSTNRFAALLAQVDSDDDEDLMTTGEDVRRAIEEGPRAVEEPKKPVLVGWAAMAAKPAQIQVVERADVAQETPKRQYPDNPWKQMGLEAEKRLQVQPRSKLWGGEVRRWGDDDSDDDDASVGSSAW
jgi:hypothetical protein